MDLKKQDQIRKVAQQIKALLSQGENLEKIMVKASGYLPETSERMAVIVIAALSYCDTIEASKKDEKNRLLAKIFVLADQNPFYQSLCFSRILDNIESVSKTGHLEMLIQMSDRLIALDQDEAMPDVFYQVWARIYERFSLLVQEDSRELYLKKAVQSINRIQDRFLPCAHWRQGLMKKIEEEEHVP